MPVFISHRTIDDDKAKVIAQRLSLHNIKCYLDHVDPEASTTPRITALLMEKINQCTHLLALITISTRDSWWVPFEIGVARQADRRIVSYESNHVVLPEYLKEWPILKTETDIDMFAEKYHRDKTAKPLIEKYASFSKTISNADEFHHSLKSALGQY
jgi:hypothetical protein